jgi:hypothetical protein
VTPARAENDSFFVPPPPVSIAAAAAMPGVSDGTAVIDVEGDDCEDDGGGFACPRSWSSFSPAPTVFDTDIEEMHALSAGDPTPSTVWLIDSGASKHMTGSLDLIEDQQPLTTEVKIYGISKEPLIATAKGNVVLKSVVDDRVHRLTLSDVLAYSTTSCRSPA